MIAPIGVLLAMPVIWWGSLALLTASVALKRDDIESLIESLLVTIVGLGLGFVAAIGGVAWLGDGLDLSYFAEGLGKYGVASRIVPVLRTGDFTAPVGVAVVTAVLASTWPAWRAVRLRPADAVRKS